MVLGEWKGSSTPLAKDPGLDLSTQPSVTLIPGNLNLSSDISMYCTTQVDLHAFKQNTYIHKIKEKKKVFLGWKGAIVFFPIIDTAASKNRLRGGKHNRLFHQIFM